MHLDRHSVASFHSTSTSHSTTVDVAPDIVVGDIGERVVGGRHAHACFSLVDAVDPEVLENCVSGDARGRCCYDGEDS